VRGLVAVEDVHDERQPAREHGRGHEGSERRQDPQQRSTGRQHEQQGTGDRQQGEMGRDEERFRSDY